MDIIKKWFFTQFTNISNITAVIAIIISIFALTKSDPKLKELEKSVQIQSEFFSQQLNEDSNRSKRLVIDREINILKFDLDSPPIISKSEYLSIQAVLIRILNNTKFKELKFESQTLILRGWIRTSNDITKIEYINLFWEQNYSVYGHKLLLDALVYIFTEAQSSAFSYKIALKIIPYIEKYATKEQKNFYYGALYERIYYIAKLQKDNNILSEIKNWSIKSNLKKQIENDINSHFSETKKVMNEPEDNMI